MSFKHTLSLSDIETTWDTRRLAPYGNVAPRYFEIDFGKRSANNCSPFDCVLKQPQRMNHGAPPDVESIAWENLLTNMTLIKPGTLRKTPPSGMCLRIST
jgi:hypothetical protein